MLFRGSVAARCFPTNSADLTDLINSDNTPKARMTCNRFQQIIGNFICLHERIRFSSRKWGSVLQSRESYYRGLANLHSARRVQATFLQDHTYSPNVNRVLVKWYLHKAASYLTKLKSSVHLLIKYTTAHSVFWENCPISRLLTHNLQMPGGISHMILLS